MHPASQLRLVDHYLKQLNVRCIIVVAAATIVVTACFVLTPRKSRPFSVHPHSSSSHAPPIHGLPPLYSQYHDSELRLPQQDWSKTRPDDHEKFFFVDGHFKHRGWGNTIGEHLLNAYLAFKAGRIFVFDNYTWEDNGHSYSDWKGHLIPAKIPYAALVRGPSVGAPFPAGVDASAAVTKEYFDHVCPKKHHLDRNDVHAKLSSGASATQIVDIWVEHLNATHNPCVQEYPVTIFNHKDVWGRRDALLDIWPDFSSSPFITHYGWSPLVELGFDTNRNLFLRPTSLPEPLLSTTPFTTNVDRYTMIQGLMVIHVRRGDYDEHCAMLADDAEDFVSVNTFPDLPDQFVVPQHAHAGGEASPENREVYRKRCFPSIEDIVEKVVEVRNTTASEGVSKLYIMTNAKPPFLDDLKDALWGASQWDMIASSRDLVLNWEQKYVAQGIDHLAAQRAQVLIGNGFSTMSSHAVMLRLANRFSAASNRFW